MCVSAWQGHEEGDGVCVARARLLRASLRWSSALGTTKKRVPFPASQIGTEGMSTRRPSVPLSATFGPSSHTKAVHILCENASRRTSPGKARQEERPPAPSLMPQSIPPSPSPCPSSSPAVELLRQLDLQLHQLRGLVEPINPRVAKLLKWATREMAEAPPPPPHWMSVFRSQVQLHEPTALE